MADFLIARMTDNNINNMPVGLGTTGTQMVSKKMLGTDGAGATGRGQWLRNDCLWKTFMLYSSDRKTAVNAGVSVRIEVCMELASDPDDPDVDTAVFELGDLTAASPTLSTENPWRYIRARGHAHAGSDVQVGFFGQGQ